MRVVQKVFGQLRINTLWQWKGYTNFLNISQIVVFMRLNIILHKILLEYSQFVAASAVFVFTFFCISLRFPEDFGSIGRGWGGFIALESHIICSSNKSCMKTKEDIVCFTLNSIFLIDKKWRLRIGKRCVRTSLFFAIWFPICFSFSSLFSPLSLFCSSPLYHASFAPSHLRYAYLI